MSEKFWQPTDRIRMDDDEPDHEPGPDVPEPLGPDQREPDDNKTLSSPINELEHRLLKQRKVLIFGAINDKVARDVTGRLLALAGASAEPIDVYVNSPGGHVESGDTIHDMIRFVDGEAPVRMIGTGWVAAASACRRRASCCISQWAACVARRWISISRRARSSRCGNA
jgi:ATP-dependent Clp protease protease subunit